ncbi:hypothetical protein LCGC14_2798280 [marine sediment metagenome]|uniref:Uncharacterized protein n=1 Tax=marine sediment metagenome TaxID=412755 RepID=A0A0F8YNL8_9ZZZZ
MPENGKKKGSVVGFLLAAAVGTVVGYKIRESMARSDRELADWRREHGANLRRAGLGSEADEWERYD